MSAVKDSGGLQQAALDEYGADLHMALRSRRDELLYLRRLTEMLFPFVMPPKATDCRWAARTRGAVQDVVWFTSAQTQCILAATQSKNNIKVHFVAEIVAFVY